MPPKRKSKRAVTKTTNKKLDVGRISTKGKGISKKKKRKPINVTCVSEHKKAKTGTTVAPSSVGTSSGTLSFKNLIKDEGWIQALESEMEEPYMLELQTKLFTDYKTKMIFPPHDLIFHALNLTPLNKVRVVIIGQDPYHDDGQAMGLCFSVPEGIAVPPSLKNMYKELETDIKGFKNPGHGDLTKWAEKGVLLLNATLTVQAHTPNSHKDYGWQKLTDKIIKIINDDCDNVVFILWGNFAQKKGKVIDEKKHCVIKSGHPSPLSVKHFLGSKCFSKTNKALKDFGLAEIDWKL